MVNCWGLSLHSFPYGNCIFALYRLWLMWVVFMPRNLHLLMHFEAKFCRLASRTEAEQCITDQIIVRHKLSFEMLEIVFKNTRYSFKCCPWHPTISRHKTQFVIYLWWCRTIFWQISLNKIKLRTFFFTTFTLSSLRVLLSSTHP